MMRTYGFMAPAGVGRTPWSAWDALVSLLEKQVRAAIDGPSRGSAADEGVRPTKK